MFRCFTTKNKILSVSDNGTYLDLSYITPQIIAMGFPASQILEKTYRNNIEEVADFLNANHKDQFIIFNLSNRKVDEQFF